MDNITEILDKFNTLDEERRIEVIQNIKKEPVSSSFIKLLKSGIADPSWRVRKTALDIVIMRSDNAQIRHLLLEGIRSHDNAGLRNTSTEGLIRIGEKALPLLEKSINDPDRDVRKIIIDVLGEIRCSRALKIVAKFLKDKDENVRSAAAEAIGKIGDKKGIKILLDSLKRDDNYLKFTALESLGQLGELYGISNINIIVGCLQNSLLGRAAYDALGRSKNVKAIKYLVEGLKDLRRSHREAALVGLFHLYNDLNNSGRTILMRELSKNFNEDLKDVLLKSLKSFTEKVKLSAAAVLSWLKVKEAVPHIVELLKESDIAEKIEEYLAGYGSIITKDIINLMKLGDDFTRAELCKVLGRIGDSYAEEYLIELLRSDSDAVVISAVEALGKLGTQKSIKELFNLFKNYEPALQSGVRNALRDLNNRFRDEIKQYALSLIHANDENLRSNAIYVLGFAGDHHVLEYINLGLKDENPSIRQVSAEALGMLGFVESIEQLAYALTDEDYRIRLSAIKSLSCIKSPKVVEALKIALKDEHVWVRVSAVKALSSYDIKGLEKEIEQLLMDDAPPVVMAVLENFKERDKKFYLKAIRKVMKHKNPEVVKECLKILKNLPVRESFNIIKESLPHPVSEIRFEVIKFLNDNFPKQFKNIQKELLKSETDEGIKQFLSQLE